VNDILHRRFDEAYARFRAACDSAPPGGIAPEALFWAGAARYKKEGIHALRHEWEELRERFPESTWARRADVWDML
jgi:TolA-binding protein